MTNEEFINLAKTCKDRKELLAKLQPGAEPTKENIKNAIAPLKAAAKLTAAQLSQLFIK